MALGELYMDKRSGFQRKIMVWFVLAGLLVVGLLAQSKQRPFQEILMDERASGACIVFVKTYVSEYKAEGEGGTRAIFRLHNNYRFPITVSVYNVEDEDLVIEQPKVKVSVLGVAYDLLEDSKQGRFRTVRRVAEEVMTLTSIDGGDDLFFSIPVEHLSRHTEIWVPFELESEAKASVGGPPPQHFAVFWGSHAPALENRKK